MASMSTPLLIASALTGLNSVLLGILAAVWLRNYRRFRTPTVLGLLAFAVVLLVENIVALYFFFDMRTLYAMDPSVHGAVAVMRALQFVAIGFLTYVTMR